MCCSAGVGRTGTFIAMDYLVKQAADENRLQFFECVKLMRLRRPRMIQTEVFIQIYWKAAFSFDCNGSICDIQFGVRFTCSSVVHMYTCCAPMCSYISCVPCTSFALLILLSSSSNLP